MKRPMFMAILLLAGWISTRGTNAAPHPTGEQACAALPSRQSLLPDPDSTASAQDFEGIILVEKEEVIIDSSEFTRYKNIDGYIARELLEHTLVNDSLKEELIRFNERFKDYESAQGRGLEISVWRISPDSIEYTIGYAAGLNSEDPALICEPIDGKPVILTFPLLWDEFSLPKRKAIEVKKFTSLKEYQMHKQDMITITVLNDKDTLLSNTTVLFHFVSLRLVYDREHHLLRRDTLGWY